MAIRRRRHKHGPEGRKQHTDQLSAQLAPLEELKPELAEAIPSNNGEYSDATIRVDSKSVLTPSNYLDEQAQSIFRLEPVVVVILIGMLAFIAFIAWQITEMPTK